jgi:hypothetical protein
VLNSTKAAMAILPRTHHNPTRLKGTRNNHILPSRTPHNHILPRAMALLKATDSPQPR